MSESVKLIIILSICLISLFVRGQSSQSDFNYNSPDSLSKLKKIDLWATQYYIHQFRSNGNIPFVDVNGKNIGMYADTCDFCEASLEGTAFITDSLGNIIVLNYAETGSKTFVDCRKCAKYTKSKLKVDSWGKTRWVVSKEYGDGVKNYKLIPYRTIAVDENFIPYGTVIYIPQAKGDTIELPNKVKVVHDGYFFAGDTGGAIKNNHIDIFTGIFKGNPFEDVIKSNSTGKFDAYLVTDKNIIDSLGLKQTKIVPQ
jgi:3D (Asp-Asp-Asp) domain-containing protein